jgi:hypothetical protein
MVVQGPLIRPSATFSPKGRRDLFVEFSESRGHLADSLDDRLKLAQHIFVRKPSDVVALCFEKLLPYSVCLVDVIVIAAVELDHQFQFQAHKVRDERTDRVLTTKLQTGEAAASQCGPDELLWFGAGLAEGS